MPQHHTPAREMSPILQLSEQGGEGEPSRDFEPVDQPDEPVAEPRLTEYNDIDVVATLEELKTAQDFISHLQNATLEGDHDFDAEARERLTEPITELFDLDADPELRAGIRLYLDTTNASDETYHDVRKSMQSYLAEIGVERMEEIPSLFSVKKEIGKLTGVHPMMNDMCINTCMAYTGPFYDLDACPHCGESRYDQRVFLASNGQKRVPRRQFYTFPVGPQLQALWRNPKDAEAMRHRTRETQKILDALEINVEQQSWDDVYSGSDYLEAVRAGKIGPDDMVLMKSIDGAQLYQSKQSDCWISIWIVLDLSADIRYKKRYVLIGTIIPGPNKPKIVDSFIYPGLHHVCALSRDGLRVWDAFQDRVFLSKLFVLLLAADGPGMTYLNGLTGHSGAYGCRIYCPTKGRRKHGANHYYPALLKPNDYSIEGCDHEDVSAWNLVGGNQLEYLEALELLLATQNQTQYQKVCKETGISKPSIFSGMPIDRILGIPASIAADIMHLFSLNTTDLKLGLWRGTIDCDPRDDKRTWDWAVLTGNTWKEHGERVADATQYLPSSFD